MMPSITKSIHNHTIQSNNIIKSINKQQTGIQRFNEPYSSDESADEEDGETTESRMFFIENVFSKVRHNRIDSVKPIIRDGFKLAARDANGNTALHICAQNNRLQLASIFVKAGCAVNARNNKGMTALDYCETYSFLKMADWLIKNGAVVGECI
jgi:hypothetical protein